jgi:parallel beta-helix repeat protein
MKRMSKYIIMAVLGTLLLSALACGIGEKADIDATVQAALAATQGAQATETGMAASVETAVAATMVAQVSPQAKTGAVIASREVEIFVPPETQGQQPPITVKEVSEPLPPAPEGSTSIGQAHEITSEGELAGPVLITLSYDPAELPPGAQEENLYIATKVGDGWEAVPDGFVDTAHHTVSASVTHFSILGLFESAGEAVYDAVEAAIGDEITSEYFGDLPDGIRYDIYDKRIKPQDVTAVVHAKLSLATKAASGVISFANLVSKTAGMAIGARENPKALATAMGEAVVAEGGGEVGSFAVMMYDSASLGKELGTFLADTSQGNPQLLAAKAAAWVLTAEMEYINANMDQAFADLWEFNPTSVSRLQVYAVYIDAEPWLESLGMGAKGVKFYYYDEGQGEWINYHDDMVYWKVKFEPVEEIAQATTAPPQATATRKPAPTSTPRPTPTPKATPTPMPTATPTRPTGPVTVYVKPDGSGDYPTIQEAVDAVAPGSTIFLDSGTYHLSESLRITRSLSLLGAGMDLTEIVLDQRAAIWFEGEGLFTVEDTTFRQPIDSEGVVLVQDGEIAFRRCRFTGGHTGLSIGGSTTGLVQDCEAVGNSLNGISLRHYAQPKLEGNRCVDNGHDGIIYGENAGGVARNNECSRNGYRGIQVAGEAQPTLEANVCRDNVDAGIAYWDNSGGVARQNECSGNGAGGIVVRDSADPYLVDNYCHNNE